MVDSIKTANPTSSGKVIGKASSQKAGVSESKLDTSDSSLESEENPNQLASLVNPENSQSSNFLGGGDEEGLTDPANFTEENPASSSETDPAPDPSAGTLLAQAGQGAMTSESSSSASAGNLSGEKEEPNGLLEGASEKQNNNDPLLEFLSPWLEGRKESDQERLDKIRSLVKKWEPQLSEEDAEKYVRNVEKYQRRTKWKLSKVLSLPEMAKQKYEELETTHILKLFQLTKEFYKSLPPNSLSLEELKHLSGMEAFWDLAKKANEVSSLNFKKSEIGNRFFEGDISEEELIKIKKEVENLNNHIAFNQGPDSLANLGISTFIDWGQQWLRIDQQVGAGFAIGAFAAAETGPLALPAGLTAAGITYKVVSARDNWKMQRGILVVDLIMGGIKRDVAKEVAEGMAFLMTGFDLIPGGVASKRIGEATKNVLLEELKTYLASNKGRKARTLLKNIAMETLEGTEKTTVNELLTAGAEDLGIILGAEEDGTLAKRGTSFSSEKNVNDLLIRAIKAAKKGFKKGVTTAPVTVPLKGQLKKQVEKIQRDAANPSNTPSITGSKSETASQRLKKINSNNFQITLLLIIRNSKAREKYPEKFKEFISDLGEKNEMGTVSIEGDRFKNYIRENGTAKKKLDNFLPGLSEELDNLKQGTRVEISLEDYVFYFLEDGKLIDAVEFNPSNPVGKISLDEFRSSQGKSKPNTQSKK